MNGFAALDIPPCRRYVVVKATAGFAVCRLILKLLLFYSCLDFTQNLGKTLRARRWVVEVTHSFFNRFRKLLVRFEKKAANYLALIQFACAIIVWRKCILVHKS